MKKHFTKLVAFVLVSGFIFSALPVYSEPGEGFRGKGKGWGRQMSEEERAERREKMHEFLGLTAEQEVQLKNHSEAHRAQRDRIRSALKEKRDALRSELRKADLDTDRISSLKNELIDLEAEKVDSLVSGILEVREILTPEQFARFQEFGRKHRQKGGERK